jgi:predicted metal-dependent phosphoesterase TrpH
MDLVTVTDHDSIDAAEQLRYHTDFFLSEEVTCYTPSGTKLHMAVHGIDEQHHLELYPPRRDLPGLVAFLGEQSLLFSINHVFSGLTGRRTDSDFEWFQRCFPVVETLNGHMLASCNDAAARFASRTRKAPMGGSDAHTLTSLGRTYTEVNGARGRREFLDGLREARGAVAGEHGSQWKLTRVVWAIGLDLMRERTWPWALFPLLALVPAITLANVWCEKAFAAKWSRRLEIASGSAQPIRWPADKAAGEVLP